MKKSFAIFFFFLVTAECSFSQSNLREKFIPVTMDTVMLDTLSLIPGTINFPGTRLDSTYYTIDHAKGFLLWNREKLDPDADSVKIVYRTFPFNLTQTTSHKDIKQLQQTKKTVTNPFTYTPSNKPVNDIFNLGGLSKNGSISRGITFGNSQDVSVNSNLNLQLSGKLSDNIDILLSASDDNIPIQPDGNTQNLQEFDKVFIQLSNKQAKLIAGDFLLTRPNSYFMNFNKKAQGLSFTNIAHKNLSPSYRGPIYDNMVTVSGAVSKGKFARNQIQGVEGNQGPYRLRGADNELFIIVLSGTEKVYIDGELLTRGQDADYVIDYNTAELRFTPNQKITKDKRIIVEFQYSDKNYARSLYHVGGEFNTYTNDKVNKLKVRLNYFSEQDSKNKPLQQELSDDQKLLLSSVGDSLMQAVVPAVDSIDYNTTDVLYVKKDSTIGTFIYYGVYVYSTDTSAHYRLSFSYVGAGNGNYNQVNSAANGKVFQWVMPDTVTGALRGAYEPVVLLTTPKKKQMLTSSVEYNINRYAKVYVEGAFTEHDINLFSGIDKKNDQGYGIKTGIDVPLNWWTIKPKDSTQHERLVSLNVNYELAQKNFSPIERYRSIEFERDWNRSLIPQSNDQHIISSSLSWRYDRSFKAGYQFNTFIEDGVYNATKHSAGIGLNTKKYVLSYDGSLLNSDSKLNRSAFFRSKGNLARKFSFLTIGARGQYEHNEFYKPGTDTLTTGSYEFGEYEGYISNADTAKNKFMLSYTQRTDNLYGNYALHKSSYAENVSFDMQLIKNVNSQFKFNVTYRNLHITDSTLSLQKPDNSLLGRTEYNFRAWKGSVSAGTYYEIGSGLELKKEFSFIQVPAGQGVYTWVDYNNDGIKQLNEFEIAAYPDQAIYIKVFTPTDQYVKTYTNAFSQTITLRPSALWSNAKGFKKFLARFSEQASYRVDRKSGDDDLAVSYNPFLRNPADSTLVSLNSSLRNTVFFNQISPVFGIDHTYSDSRTKALLTNGFDSRTNTFHEVRGRWNINKQFTLQMMYRSGTKTSTSQFFTLRNYTIVYSESEPRLSYQPNTSFRVSVSYRYSEKKNSPDLGGQLAILNNFGTELKYNVLNKGSFQAKANYIRISYNDVQNTSIAFEMLESLKTGENITWGVTYQRNLSNNMQLSLTYDGRRSEGTKVIHVGGAQVRAFF